MDLEGRVALVTGGGRRLGKAVVLKLAERGARVVIHYHHSADEAAATAAEVARMGGEARLVQGDLARKEEAERVVSDAAAFWGRLDILVNNAAAFFPTPLGQVSEEQWDQLFDVNLKGVFFCSQQAAAEMAAGDGGGAGGGVPRQPGGARRLPGGVIINFVDTGIYITWKGYTPYLMSKAGVEQMTYGLAKELAPDIRVNAVALGPVLLPNGHSAVEADKFAAATLLKRLGGSDALAEAVLYLIEADFVTGVVLPVDGGQRWYGQ
jgi:NAD(P)-dependent dehydrogenase (short-subunit alcohol dehydrogenase family)